MMRRSSKAYPLAYCYISKAKRFIPVYRLGEDGDLL